MKNIALLIALGLCAAACNNPTPAPAPVQPPATDTLSKAPETPPAIVAPANAKLRLVVAPPAAPFPGASLVLKSTTPDAKKGEVKYEYTVGGYELKAQTPDATTRGCANSKDGQHIHFILNNKPYLAKYEAAFSEKVDAGRNIALSFLSRSYHESLKNNKAVVVTEIMGPGEGGVQGGDLAKDPWLFYSRPKGDYKKADGDKMLLDFYLLNTDLKDKDLRVRATLDGEVWVLSQWEAYFIEGLELGKHTVRLELIDAAGNAVPGPFNDSGVREFNYLAS